MRGLIVLLIIIPHAVYIYRKTDNGSVRNQIQAASMGNAHGPLSFCSGSYLILSQHLPRYYFNTI